MDLAAELTRALPDLRGRLSANTRLADLTWFRVGGPAQVLFSPADEADLAYVLGRIDPKMPVTVIGLGSNLLVRDGGVPGMVIRLGKGFGDVAAEAATGSAPARRCLTRKWRARPPRRASAVSRSTRHSRVHRRGAAHERRGARDGDQGRAGQLPRG